MSAKHFFPTGTATALLLAASSAWALDLDKLREAGDDNQVAYEGRTIEQIEDMDLVNKAGEKIGEVDDVLVDKKNRAKAVVVDVADADHDVVVELDKLTIANAQSTSFVTSKSARELADLPRWRE